MSGLAGGPKPQAAPAPPVPDRTEAETADLAAQQRERIRRALGRRTSAITGGAGAATSTNSGLVALLGGTS